MSESFDPYHVWLGIPPSEQPPHYYRLLGIPLYETDPVVITTAAQRQMARELFEKGADVILGSHPHVIQNAEVYKNKMIFYSLGNFVFDQNFSPETMQGLGLVVTLNTTGVERVQQLPFNINKSYQPELDVQKKK